MPRMYDFKCNKCKFELDGGSGGYIYATGDKGERIVCAHPGEASAVARVLGIKREDIPGFFPWLWDAKDATPKVRELIEKRVGFNSFCICLDCLFEFDLDMKKDEKKCPKCKSENIKPIFELANKPCPKCKKGKIKMIAGTIT